MNHDDHLYLIRDGVSGPGVWADFGSGWGAFTLALADLLSPGSTIYSVDKDRSALRDQERAMRSRFPEVDVHYLAADFTQPLDLPPLDGIVMANSLHFQRDQDAVLQRVRGYLKPGARLVLVEYNTDRGNSWVPYPFSYATWETLARRAGFTNTRLLATRSGRHDAMYSALSM
jgi:ubiquinone/menaquinone biosynthesis C-methylase UbiE